MICTNAFATVGIIPAYAGSTPRFDSPCAAPRDHPRVCGEHALITRIRQMLSGSSPRMRGALGSHRCEPALVGIIPAYAGSTLLTPSTSLMMRDHPRVCGEHDGYCTIPDRDQGSSPRMRGAPGFAGVLGFAGGIIPAYAGSTPFIFTKQTIRRDHPRVCGEHDYRLRRKPQVPGSSPRMRGARD